MHRNQENEEKLKKGHNVFRFWSNEIKKGKSACAEPIIKYIENKKS